MANNELKYKISVLLISKTVHLSFTLDTISILLIKYIRKL